MADIWDGKKIWINELGHMIHSESGIAEMMFPVKHLRCGDVHDAAAQEVVARYSDCTLWRCPGCKVLIDDRKWTRQIEDLRPQKKRQFFD